MRKRKQSIKLNNTDSLQGLMQEAYNDVCGQMTDIQKAINELSLSATPEDVDDITKVSREKSNLLKLKDSAVRVKVDIGKLLNDIIKHNGSIEDTDETRVTAGSAPTMDELKNIRKMIMDSNKGE